jgi:hypothetical protein
MDYHLHRQGQNLGVFSLEELRRRRAAGELSGEDWVWREGMTNWAPLDTVLGPSTSAQPPPVPAAGLKSNANRLPTWGIVAAVVLVATGIASLVVLGVRIGQGVRQVRQVQQGQMNSANSTEVAVAAKAVVVSTNSRTETVVNQKRRQFRIRQWVDGYKNNGQHTAAWDRDAAELMESWVASYFGGTTNLPSPQALGDKIAADPSCDDPLVLTAAGANCTELHEKTRRLERAVAAFDKSHYRAYPKFFATVELSDELGNRSTGVPGLDQRAVGHFKQAFTDGSFQPDDEEEIAELLVNGWANGFFQRNGASVCEVVKQARGYTWLAHVLEGDHEINEAWKARGAGWADSVSSQGWQGFSDHLAKAQLALTQAWKTHPERPLAPSRMITAAMGAEGIPEMRTWFDRAVEAQIDYPQAWSHMRWGLRPRWGGSLEAMLALGVRAVETKRFDTDVPRKFFDFVSDVESEMQLQPGEHIYGRPDIWPHLQKMYEGYLAEPLPKQSLAGWRSSYLAVAFLARKYDVARKQLEALNWTPTHKNLTGWGTDLSLMPLKVAALTGASADEVRRAESSYDRRDLSTPVQVYTQLSSASDTDERTRQFSRCRLAALKQEQQLSKGEWIELMPTDDKDLNWVFDGDKVRRLDDGALEVESGARGHGFYCRTVVGPQFEITGEFELVRSSTHDFQAGLLMGLPDGMQSHWYAFRMKRNDTEGQVASFSFGWSTRQVAHPITLNEGRNTFRFVLKNGKADAWVNGTQALQRAAPEKTLALSRNCFLGLGAYNDMNETLIRYRNVKARRLNGAAATNSAETGE